QAEDGIRDWSVTGVQTCALPIWRESENYSRESGQTPDYVVFVARGAPAHRSVIEEMSSTSELTLTPAFPILPPLIYTRLFHGMCPNIPCAVRSPGEDPGLHEAGPAERRAAQTE